MRNLILVWALALFASVYAFSEEETYEEYLNYRADTRAAYESLSYEQKEEARNYSDYVEGKIKQGRLNELSDRAMTRLLEVASRELAKRGYSDQAKIMMGEWLYEQRPKFYERDLGDLPGLSQWITERYLVIELILGKDVCRALHLSDMMTFNHAIPVCLACNPVVDVDEYGRHFIESDSGRFRGFAPCVTWWVTEIICMTASSGIGAFICGPISMGTEYLMREYAAPKISPWLWDKVCN